MTLTLILWTTIIVFLLGNYAIGFKFRVRTVLGVGALMIALAILTYMGLTVFAEADTQALSRLLR